MKKKILKFFGYLIIASIMPVLFEIVRLYSGDKLTEWYMPVAFGYIAEFGVLILAAILVMGLKLIGEN